MLETKQLKRNGTQNEQGPRKGEDDRHKLKVALEDLYNGKTCRLAVTRNKTCTVCDGVGGKPGAQKACEKCQGRGVQVRTRCTKGWRGSVRLRTRAVCPRWGGQRGRVGGGGTE